MKKNILSRLNPFTDWKAEVPEPMTEKQWGEFVRSVGSECDKYDLFWETHPDGLVIHKPRHLNVRI